MAGTLQQFIKKRIGTDDTPRNVMIWHGPHYEENWINWGEGWNQSPNNRAQIPVLRYN
jgi:hypothetical protein